MSLPHHHVGGTFEFTDTLTKNGVTWNLTGATVTLVLRRPDDTTVELAASGTSLGVVTYTSDDSPQTLDMSGRWMRQWHVVQSAINVYVLPTYFYVHGAPSSFLGG
jgi:hypothetical protein